MRELKIWDDRFGTENKKTRVGCRGLLLKGNEILLSYEAKGDRYFTPGGGLEEGETLAEGCKRELAEECGISARIGEQLLTVNCYYYKMNYQNHFFLCEYEGETEQNLTEEERRNGLVPVFLPLEEAIQLFSNYERFIYTNEMMRGSYLRDYKVLSELKDYLEEKRNG